MVLVFRYSRGYAEKKLSYMMHENEITGMLVNTFINVHSTLGPGLLESVYEEIICYEMEKRGIRYRRQQPISVIYDNIKMDIGFRADIIVENKVIVELKSINMLAPVHHKILLT